MSEDEDDDASKLAALQAELATLRLKAKEGGKLSGKDKRQLKKLEAAEERWKEYAAVAAPSAEEDEGSSGSSSDESIDLSKVSRHTEVNI